MEQARRFHREPHALFGQAVAARAWETPGKCVPRSRMAVAWGCAGERSFAADFSTGEDWTRGCLAVYNPPRFRFNVPWRKTACASP